MASHKTFLTEAGRKALQEELNHLRFARRKEVAARIHKASESGGTVDNAEYDEAKNEQALVEGRLRDVENILSVAVIAPSHDEAGGAVDIGASVTVKTEDGRKQRYTVVGSAEAAPLDGKISNESPVGQALLGHKVGDQVRVETPSRVMSLTITKIE